MKAFLPAGKEEELGPRQDRLLGEAAANKVHVLRWSGRKLGGLEARGFRV